jgi:hypothetical protein
MDFRRSGQLDERRRRVLMDEIASPTDADSPDPALAAGGSAKGPVRAYSPAVLAERQPKVTDLLPVRPLLVLALVLLALTGIAAIEAIHVHLVTLPQLVEQTASLSSRSDVQRATVHHAHLQALDVRERGSLAAWYSSALLATAVGLSLVIYGIRSHRVDDYRGRYRVWLWVTAAVAWLSLDAATSVHDGIGLAITLLAGKQAGHLASFSALTWVALYGILFGTLALRLAIELWSSLASFASLAVASLLYTTAALIQLDMVPLANPLLAPVVESTITMLAHVALLTTLGLYARHVYLDAQGRLKVHIDPDLKKGKSKNRTKLKVIKADKQSDSTDQPKPAVAATSTPLGSFKFGSSTANASAPLAKASASLSKSNVSSQDQDDEDDEDADDAYGSNLSKSERRRLKKLARRDQQRRAA